MSLAQRLSIAAAGLVAIVLAFVLLQPGGGRDQEQVAAPTPASVTARAPAGTTPATTPTTRAPARPAAPKVQTIRVRGGKPVGGMQDIEVDKGKTVRFRVVADAAEVVHLHGYDIAKPVAPGRSATFSFKATIDGRFELELENSAEPIAELSVFPS